MLVGPFMARGVYQSGYVAFPSAVGGFPVEWRVSREASNALAETIRGWARAGDQWQDLSRGHAWFWPWAKHMAFRFVEISVPLAMALLGLLAILAARVVAGRQGEGLGMRWLFLLPSALSLVVWYAGAPAPRMIGAGSWMLGGGATVLACREAGFVSERVKVVGLVLFSALLTAYALHDERFAGPGPQRGFYPKPVAEMKVVQTRSGLAVYVPAKGSQCWDAPLPCAPGVNPDLRLRRDGDLAGGFLLGSK